MIIGNNNTNRPSNNFNRPNNFNTSMKNNFENKWQKINEQNKNNQTRKNIFVKNIKEQKYASANNTEAMYDKSLAMLHERLEKKLISIEEFNQKCAQLGKQREMLNKKNKLF